MKITPADWLVVAGYFVLNLLIGLYYRRRASANTGEFFISGREVSWWLAGTSMVAATFAADTPLVVTGYVATQGIAGNWIWWSFLLSGMMTVFFFARLWRRAEIVTDVELVELRYAGKPAAFLRGFRALYFGMLMNCLIVGWVNLAMEKIVSTVIPSPDWFTRLDQSLHLSSGLTVLTHEHVGTSKTWALAIIFAIIALTSFYTFISGLWGVLWTDLIQFVLKMSMVVVLAYYGVEAAGGMHTMLAKLAVVDARQQAATGGRGSILDFAPVIHSAWMPILTFCLYLGVQWWANWYPGAEPGGGGYVAQRMFSAKDEKNSLGATLWFNIAHYALRPWPWILTALASVVLYPNLKDKEVGFIKVWVDYLPGGWSGLMLAAFAAAYMSTIATQLNWGSSYLINDFYRRFMKRNASERHYVNASKLATAYLAILGAFISLFMTSIGGAWQLLLGVGAGTGAVYLLRWYWWRINAWSEASAMAAAALITLLLNVKFGGHLLITFSGSEPDVFAKTIFLTVAVTTVVWALVTYLTAPEPEWKLVEFYRRVRPGVVGWKPMARLAPEVHVSGDGWYNLMDWLLGCLMVYMVLFGFGKIIFGSVALGVVFLVIAAIAGYLIYRDLSRRGWKTLSE
jgi:SSS family solute:Na+ symporter